MLFPDVFFHRSLWIPLRWGTKNIHRYVDLTGYLQLKSGLRSKMPPTAILSIFLHKPMAGPHCRTGFSRGVVPRRFLGFSLYWSTGKFKKRDRACWSSELYLGFVSAKEKLVCSYKMIHGEKVKSEQKTLCTCHRISGYGSRQTPARFCIWSNQRGFFTERGRWNWTFTKYELLLHRHEATAPAHALAKQKLYAISMHCSWRT